MSYTHSMSLDAKMTPAQSESGTEREPVAIVGHAWRLPGADNVAQLWDLLTNTGQTRSRPTRLDNHDQFDAAFFGISDAEAQYMDPQQRLILEVAWQALEAAGQSPRELRGSKTGVFVGVAMSEYAHLLSRHGGRHRHAVTGTSTSIIANRLSYLLDLRGPSMALNTACSSSLTALHLAKEALRNRSCDTAIVGGVNVLLDPAVSEALHASGMLSSETHCRVFDAQASGYVRGEGCIVLILRRESDAQARGDRIHGLVRGSALQQDGKTNGLTAPNGLAQADVVRAALADAGMAARDISYVEAHGGATVMGDAIELDALGGIWREQDAGSCHVGSIKPLVGHLEAASGLAGVAKVLSMFAHGHIPPQVGLDRLNPLVEKAGSPLVIASSAVPWAPRGPRSAGISSFGLGGTIGHAVLSEPRPSAAARLPDKPWRGPFLATLSAPSPAQWSAAADDLLEALASLKTDALPSVCMTLACGRQPHAWRAAWVVDSLAQLQAVLLAERASLSTRSRSAPAARLRCAMVFGDDDAMAIERRTEAWSERWPIFAEEVRHVDGMLRQHAPGHHGLGEGGRGRWQALGHHLALWHFMCRLGIVPDQVAGDGVGRMAAAVVSGTVPLADVIDALKGGLDHAMVAPARTSVAGGAVRWVGQRWLMQPGDLGLPDEAARPLSSPEPGKTAAGQGLLIAVGCAAQQAARLFPGAPCILERETAMGDPARWLLSVMAAAYETGFDLDYRPLFPADRCTRMVLPGVRFQRARLWAPELEAVAACVQPSLSPTSPTDESSSRAAAYPRVLQVVDWTKADVPVRSGRRQQWRLFNAGIDAGDAASLARALEDAGGLAMSAQDHDPPNQEGVNLVLVCPVADAGHPEHVRVAASFTRTVMQSSQPDRAKAVKVWLLGRPGAWPLLASVLQTLNAAGASLSGGIVEMPHAPADPMGTSKLAEWLNAQADGTWSQARCRGTEVEVAVTRPRRKADDTGRTAIRAGASYVVSGAWTDGGLAAAMYLCRRGAGRLILIDSQPPPPSAKWNALQPGDPWFRRIQAIREMEALGVSVSCRASNVADAVDSAMLMMTLDVQETRHVAGIIDAAGAQETARLVFNRGAGLTDLLRHVPLDFVLLLRAEDASDAQACIDEPLMASVLAAQAGLGRADALFRCVYIEGGHTGEVLEWDALLDASLGCSQALLLSAVQDPAADLIEGRVSTRASVSVSHADERPLSATEEALADIWRRVLGLDVVAVDDAFFDLGGDSIGAVEVLAEVQTAFGVRLPLSKAMAAFDLRQIAALIDEAVAKGVPIAPSAGAPSPERPLSLDDLAALEEGDMDGSLG